MGPKKSKKKMKKIEVPLDTPTEFELGDAAVYLHGRREDREQRDREEAEKQQGRREKKPGTEIPRSTEEAVAEKRPITERNESEMDTEDGGEAGTSQSQSRHEKEYMMKIYLTDLDKQAIVDFVKDHVELYIKINEHFKDKARKNCL